MTSRRRWLVHGLLAVMVGGNLYDIATGGEHWPFSPYPMYSYALTEWTTLVSRVVGVEADGREMTLSETHLLEPFDQARLLQSLQTLLPEPDGRARVAKALTDVLERYERRRAAGEHDGPPLRALRFYHQTWSIDPAARNVDRPDRQDLVLEVTWPAAST